MTTTRTRVQNNLAPAVPVIRKHTYTNGTSFSEQPFNGYISGVSKSMSDCVNPGWRERQRRGEIVMSDMQIEIHEIAAPITSSFTIGPHTPTNWGSSVYTGDLSAMVATGVIPSLPGIPSMGMSLYDQALIKAYAKMNASKVLSGETLSDLGRTVMMFRRPFQGATDLLARMIKSRNRNLGKTTVSAAKASANAWLEYRYGWKPVLMDAEAIAAIAQQKRDKIIRKHRLVARSAVDASYVTTSPFSTSVLGGTATGSVTRKITRRAHAGVIYERRAQSVLSAYAADLGLGAKDLPVLFWEKIPFSFVVDWFVNVGDYIQAVIPNPDVTVLANWVTTITEDDVNIGTSQLSCSLTYGGTTRTYTGSIPGHTRKTSWISRDTHPVFPTMPTVTAGIKDLSLLHTTDALSLMVSGIRESLGVMRH